MDLVPRAQWKARAYRRPNGAIRYVSTPRGVKMHYLGVGYPARSHDQCAVYVRGLQTYHMDNHKWSDIGYSFLVCTHGTIYEGRGLERRNSANGNTALNEQHYAVCALVGTAGVVTPTAPQVQGLRDAVAHCRSEGGAGWEILGHRDGYQTDCPGAVLHRMVHEGELEPVSGAAYTVRGGDFLSAIAKKYPGVSWQEIAEENDIPEPYTIYPGQKLRIPGVSTCTVRSGDTLNAIALRYPGVSWQQIATANRIPSPYLIYPGDTLIIPGMS